MLAKARHGQFEEDVFIRADPTTCRWAMGLHGPASSPPRMKRIVLLTFASMALHLAAFYVEESSIDLTTWSLAAKGILEDGDFYRSTFPDNCFCYPPLWAWVLAPIGALIDPVGQYRLFAFASRLPIMMGNLAVGSLLLKKFRADMGIFSLWMLNPVAIGVAQAGDFDVLPAMLSLLAIWFAERRELIPSAISLGLGIALKIYPIMFLPIILLGFSKRDLKPALCFLITSLAIPIAASMPYYFLTPYFIPSLFGYNAPRISSAGFLIYAMVYLLALAYSRFRGLSILEASALCLLPFYLILTPHDQYYIWVLVPLFAIFASDRLGWDFLALSSLSILSAVNRYLGFATARWPTLPWAMPWIRTAVQAGNALCILFLIFRLAILGPRNRSP